MAIFGSVEELKNEVNAWIYANDSGLITAEVLQEKLHDIIDTVCSLSETALELKADLIGGVIPAAQLPSYVDDVLEYANAAAFPGTGESGKIYIALDTNITYRWGGSVYVEIAQSLALGETSSTAYRGDRGKTAYDHTSRNDNPHAVTAAQLGLGNVTNESKSTMFNNPAFTGTVSMGYFTFEVSGTNLLIKYNGALIAQLSSTGQLKTLLAADTFDLPTVSLTAYGFTATSKSCTVTRGSTSVPFSFIPNVTGTAQFSIWKNGHVISGLTYDDIIESPTTYYGEFALLSAADYDEVYEIKISYQA